MMPSRVFSGSRSTRLAILLMLEVLALAYLQSPAERFVRYIAFDSSVDLSMQYLLDHGSVPTVDFACIYGLVPLILNRAWYGLAGLTPGAYRVEVLVCLCIMAWGLARFARARRIGPAGIALIVLAMPDILFPAYSTVVHVLEPALLVHGLAEQARGRRRHALALATAACFVKPAMGYVYGACLLIGIAADSLRKRPETGQDRDWETGFRALVPAALVGALLSALVIAAYGVKPLLGSILPIQGASVYRLNRFGFFTGIGSEFWAWPKGGFWEYFRYEVGFWMLGTLWLIAGGIAAFVRLCRGRSTGDEVIDDELAACCATLHVVFITCMFGLRTSWTYYFTILILGLAVLSKRGRTGLVVAWILAALLLVNDRSKLLQVRQEWATSAPGADTLGLWATAEERSEWIEVRELIRGGTPPVLLAWVDGSVPLLPEFAPPVAGYFCPGLTLPIEIRRKADQLRSASWIVTVVHRDWEGFAQWPELADAFDGTELAFEGKTFRAYRRIRPPASARSSPGNSGGP